MFLSLSLTVSLEAICQETIHKPYVFKRPAFLKVAMKLEIAAILMRAP